MISYSVTIDGGAAHQQAGDSLAPNQTHCMMVNGAELTAIVRLQGDEGGAELSAFAEPGCDQHHLEAVWNGTWGLRWHSADCP